MTNREIFDLVVHLGEITLKNGGEIARTKITMERAAKIYGIQDFHTYVVANGIFSTGVMEEGITYSTKIQSVPISSTCLCRVEAVNNLSREIVSGSVPPEKAKKRLAEIEVMVSDKKYVKLLSSGIGSACFCYLLAGTIKDSIVVFFSGCLLYCFLSYLQVNANIPKFMHNLLGSSFVALFCCTAAEFGIGDSLDKMIIGSIMTLVPGVPLTNSIRHFFDDDYLSGVIRLFDAFLVALSIAMGVGIIILLWNWVVGGIVI